MSACVVEWLALATGALSLAGGLGIGALPGFGILAMGMLSDSLFSGWGRRLYFIQAGYRVAYLVAMGAICGASHR